MSKKIQAAATGLVLSSAFLVLLISSIGFAETAKSEGSNPAKPETKVNSRDIKVLPDGRILFLISHSFHQIELKNGGVTH